MAASSWRVRPAVSRSKSRGGAAPAATAPGRMHRSRGRQAGASNRLGQELRPEHETSGPGVSDRNRGRAAFTAGEQDHQRDGRQPGAGPKDGAMTEGGGESAERKIPDGRADPAGGGI